MILCFISLNLRLCLNIAILYDYNYTVLEMTMNVILCKGSHQRHDFSVMKYLIFKLQILKSAKSFYY